MPGLAVPVNVLLATSNDRAIAATMAMSADRGWRPVYWLAARSAAPAIARLFPDTTIHDYLSSVRGIPAAGFEAGVGGAVDLGFWRDRARQLLVAVHMLERNDSVARDMDIKQRVDFVHRLSAYWSHVLRVLKPDLIVFEEEPHQASDYVLYLHAVGRGVRTLMPIRTMPTWGFLASERFEEGAVLLSQPSPDVLPDFVNASIRALTGEYGPARRLMLWDQLPSLETASASERMIRHLVRVRRALARLGRYVENLRTFESDQKVRRRALHHSRLSYFRYVISKVQTLRTKRANRSAYDELAGDLASAELDSPFVYFALSYQPEKSTSPCGDEFVNQLLAIRTVAAALPTGWRVFVKEHPSQFVSAYSRYGESFRSRAYYEEILALPSTRLVPMGVTPYALMDRAEAVVTVGGSAGFEALVRGRRSLLFGHTWYATCPGIARVSTTEEVRTALTMPPPDETKRANHLEVFLSSVAASLYRSPAGRSDAALFAAKSAEQEYLRFFVEQHDRMFGAAQ